MSMLTRQFISSLLVAFLLVPQSFGAWRVNLNPWRERRQDDIATVQVAVQSIAPFEDYIDSLQPHFPIDEKSALDDAVAQTRTQDTQELQAFTAALQVRGPEVTKSSDKTTTDDGSGATPKTTSTVINKENPGALSDVAVPAAVARTLTASLPDSATKLEASIRYNAATALMQRIALLNNYVRDAAVQNHTKPYLVRMLVTVLPTAATRGYDAYTTVSFFSTSKNLDDHDASPFVATGFAQRSAERLAELEARSKEGLTSKELRDLNHQIREERLNVKVLEDAKQANCDDHPIDTIPLLVTDSVTSSLQSDTLERIRDISAAAQAIQANTRIGAGLRTQRDRIDKSLARNINGVMTVSRVAQNSIEVRLGAMFGNRDDALVPRTYDVTALLLFPLPSTRREGDASEFISDDVIPCSVVTYTAQTAFRDSRNGKVARPASVNALNDKVKDMLSNSNLDVEMAADLVKSAREGNYATFKSKFESRDAAQAVLLWPQIVAIVSRHSFSRGLFQAPVRDVDMFDDTSASLFDDTKIAVMTIPGGRNLRADRLAGLVEIKPKSGAAFRLVAKSVEVKSDPRRAIFTFDSPTKFTKDVDTVMATVRYVRGARDWEADITSVWGPNAVSFVPALDPPKEQKKDLRFTLKTGAKTVTSKDGTGTIRVSLKRAKADDDFPMFFSVDGADVVEVDGSLKSSGADWKSESDGSGVVKLANLIPGNAITIHAFSLDNKKAVDEQDVTLNVQPQLVVVTAAKEK